MIYAVYIHHDEGSAVGATVPDFAGCFAAADTLEGIPAAVQEAAELYFDGEDAEIPAPTPLATLKKDAAYKGGDWLLVDVDTSKLAVEKARVNVSLPKFALVEIDAFAQTQRMNRSELLTQSTLTLIRQWREKPDAPASIKMTRSGQTVFFMAVKSRSERAAAAKRRPAVAKKVAAKKAQKKAVKKVKARDEPCGRKARA